MTDFRPSITSGIVPPADGNRLWGLAERYLNISGEGYETSSCNGRRYVLMPTASMHQRWWEQALKVISYCSVIFPLIALAYRTYCRSNHIFVLGSSLPLAQPSATARLEETGKRLSSDQAGPEHPSSEPVHSSANTGSANASGVGSAPHLARPLATAHLEELGKKSPRDQTRVEHPSSPALPLASLPEDKNTYLRGDPVFEKDGSIKRGWEWGADRQPRRREGGDPVYQGGELVEGFVYDDFGVPVWLGR